MGEEHPISVWLVCKLCGQAFQVMTQFIEHKKHKHFLEFQEITCIVFEERTLNLDFVYGYASTSSASQTQFDQLGIAEEVSVPVAPASKPPYNVEIPKSLEKQEDSSLPAPAPAPTLPVIGCKTETDDHNNPSNLIPEPLGTNHEFEEQVLQEPENTDFPCDDGDLTIMPTDVLKLDLKTEEKEIETEPIFIDHTEEEDAFIPESSIDEQYSIFENEAQVGDKKYVDIKIPSPHKAYVLVKRLTGREIKTASSSRPVRRIRLRKIEEAAELESVTCFSDTDFDTVVDLTSETENSMPMTFNSDDAAENSSSTVVDTKLEPNLAAELTSTSSNSLPSTSAVEYPMKCEFCKQLFLIKAEFRAHMKLCLEQTQLLIHHCIPCNKTFRSSYGLKRHNLNLHEGNNNNNNSNSNKKQGGFQTLSMPSVSLKCKCEYCPKEFLSPFVLKCHTQSHLNKGDEKASREPEPDPTSGKEPSSPSKHYSSNSRSNPFNKNSLSSRLKPYSPKRSVKRQRKNDKKVRYLCPVHNCGQSFTKNYNVKRHMMRRHTKMAEDLIQTITIREAESFESEEYSCPDLDPEAASFTDGSPTDSKTIEDENVEIVGDANDAEPSGSPKPFKCLHQYCSESFSTVTALRGHLITHFDADPFQQSEQDNVQDHHSNSSKSELELEERNYKCQKEGCDKAFTRADNLRRHTIRYHKEKREQIDYQYQPSLRKKPHVDEIIILSDDDEDTGTETGPDSDNCSFKAQKLSQLTRPACTVENCGVTFSRMDSLKRHMERKHKDKSVEKSFEDMPVLHMEIDLDTND